VGEGRTTSKPQTTNEKCAHSKKNAEKTKNRKNLLTGFVARTHQTTGTPKEQLGLKPDGVSTLRGMNTNFNLPNM